MPKRFTLKFPSSAYIGRVETAYKNLYEKVHQNITNLLIDLRDCQFIEMTSLIWLISLVKSRINKNFYTEFELPKEKDVRDFMEIWNFPEAILSTTGVPLYNMSTVESQVYFKKNDDEDKPIKYSGHVSDDGKNRLLSTRFFSIIVFLSRLFIENNNEIISKSNRFNTQLVRSVLEAQLNGSVKYIPSNIVFEAILNATRHPNANFVVLSSFLDGIKEFEFATKESFTITIWDDGKSIIDTLHDALKQNKKIRAECEDKYLQDKFVLIFEEPDGSKTSKEIISSNFTPSRFVNDQYVLFSSLLPGITRDIKGEGNIMYSNEEISSNHPTTPGMGLYILLNATIDIFGGELSIRTKNYFLNIKKWGLKDAKYRVKIYEFPKSTPTFLGNMLTVRLPLVKYKE